MPDTSPPDPADHAEDFSRRYAQALDIEASQTLTVGHLLNPNGSPGRGATLIAAQNRGPYQPR